MAERSEVGRGRSRGRKHVVRRYHRGTDLFRRYAPPSHLVRDGTRRVSAGRARFRFEGEGFWRPCGWRSMSLKGKASSRSCLSSTHAQRRGFMPRKFLDNGLGRHSLSGQANPAQRRVARWRRMPAQGPHCQGNRGINPRHSLLHLLDNLAGLVARGRKSLRIASIQG